MLNIRLVPTAEVKARWTAEIKDGHGTAILSQLVQPWYLAVTRDSCVIWYDEISKRRNTAGRTCAADTYRPRLHVPLSPRSSCNRGSPGVITGQAILDRWVASRTRHLSTFCSRSFRCPPSHPIPASRALSRQISILRIPPLNSLYPRSRKILPQTSVIREPKTQKHAENKCVHVYGNLSLSNTGSIVCADFYFAIVEAAEVMGGLDLKFVAS
jgi:hypothetical protein